MVALYFFVTAAATAWTGIANDNGLASQISLRTATSKPAARHPSPHHRRSSPSRYAMILADGCSTMDDGCSPSPEMVHDRFNLMSTTALTSLTCAAHFQDPLWNTPLTAVMCLYLAIDSIWLVAQPEIAGSGGEGDSSTSSSGGALTLLSHHLFALIVSLHALTWAPHTHYTCQMTVVEVNTLILMLERQLPDGAAIAPAVHLLFTSSWVLLRVLWFPYLAAKLALLGDYPSEAVHLACAASLLALVVHQLIWTWNFCVPEKWWFPLP